MYVAKVVPKILLASIAGCDMSLPKNLSKRFIPCEFSCNAVMTARGLPIGCIQLSNHFMMMSLSVISMAEKLTVTTVTQARYSDADEGRSGTSRDDRSLNLYMSSSSETDHVRSSLSG